MKFEEEFPSMIDKESEGEQYAFTEDTIKKYCKDNQKIKEAINKIFTVQNMGSIYSKGLKRLLLIELGLNNEQK